MSEPVCTCGCGQVIPRKHLFRYKEPYLLRGHQPAEPLICQCGCGGVIPWLDHYRTNPAKTLPGHMSPTKRESYVTRRVVFKPPNPSGLCQCGCGGMTPIATKTWRGNGHLKDHHVRFINGHAQRGKKRPDSGDGRYVNPFGYVLVYAPRHPWAKKMGGYVLEHRLVMERHIGRGLARWEHVHHKNGDKLDNRLENLEVVAMREHGTRHGRPRGWQMTPEQKVEHSERMRRWWAERKA